MRGCLFFRKALKANMVSKMVFVLLAVLTHVVGLSNNNKKKPNIVFLLADDLGWTAGGCFGSTYYETPNIDRLAKEGMRFDHGYATMMNCMPSRASIMSGQYTTRHKMYSVTNFQDKVKKRNGDLSRFKFLQPPLVKNLSKDILTIAESLKKVGYTTAMFGKWHLGYGTEYHPSKRGFDEAIVSQRKHYNFVTVPPVEHDSNQYLSDFLADCSIDFIERHSKSDKPFFLFFSDFLVHKPLEAKQEYIDYFTAKEKSEYHKSPVAAAMIKSHDESIGRIIDKLDELGLSEETLVIFNSDNGGLGYSEDGKRLENTSNYPLRYFKGFEFDGGLRVPYIFKWPGKIPANTLNSQYIINIDLYPTILSITGAPEPDHVLDGVNLIPILEDPEATLPPRDIFFYLPIYSSFNRPCVIARRGDLKMIHLFEEDRNELYHTGTDINESTDISAQYPELVQELKNAAFRWLEETGAPEFAPNPEYKAE